MTNQRREYWAFPVVPVFNLQGQKTGEWKPSGQLPTKVYSREVFKNDGTRIYPARPGEDAQAAFDECVEYAGLTGYVWTANRPNATRYVERPKAAKAEQPATESMFDLSSVPTVAKAKRAKARKVLA